MGFTEAVFELVVEEGASVAEHSVSIATESDTALTSVQSGRHSCTNCERDGQTADRCFHNPSSKNYKKEIRYDFSKKTKSKTRKSKGKKIDSKDDNGNC